MSRVPRAELALPVVIGVAAVILAASELLVTFEFSPPRGEPLRESTGADQHGYALLLLGLFAVGAMAAAIVTGSRPAAFAVAAAGAVAVLIFVILDLPNAGRLGDLDDPVHGIAAARAEPQIGFWLQMISSVTLAVAGGAFATLTPAQLRLPALRLGLLRVEPAEANPGEPDRADEPFEPAETEPADLDVPDGKPPAPATDGARPARRILKR